MTGSGNCHTGVCPVCQSEAALRCSACYTVFYCSPACQKEDWKSHKAHCKKPYIVEENALAGRIMVASRDLAPGDIILKEKPALIGPNMDQSQPLCLACYALLNPKKFHPCRKCKAPLCSPQCETHPDHLQECSEFKQCPMGFYSSYDNGVMIRRSKPDLKWANYQLVLPVRAMLLKKSDLKKYRQFMNLQSHLEDRRGTSAEETVRNKVVRILEQYKFQGGTWNEESVQTICGIFDTNSFELGVKGGKSLITGVYPQASMMMHSCLKNTRLTFGQDLSMTILARDHIKKGETIYHGYARSFNTTTMRRVMLFSGKHFGCECVRCLDPTEMGSFCSALLCQRCLPNIPESDKKGDWADRIAVLPDQPIDLNSQWKCRKCSNPHQMTGPQIASLERNLTMQLESIGSTDIEGLETFLIQQENLLHPNHASIVSAKNMIAVGYGRFTGYEKSRLSDLQLERKIELCRDVYKVTQIVERGISTKIGLAAYELAMALIWKADRIQPQPPREEKDNNGKSKSKKRNDTTNQGSASHNLFREEARDLLVKSSEILSYESPGTNHGMLGQAAKAELAKLQVQ